MGDDEVTDVLVVGAGPTGLCAALTLLRSGVDVMIVDGKSGPTRESRALAVQARTMEIYAQLGVADRALGEAVAADAIVPGYGPRAFTPVPLRELGHGLTPYPHLYVLEQSRNERILSDALRTGGTPVRWGLHVDAVTIAAVGEPRVEAVLTANDGSSSVVRARYCIAADGGSSRVRELLGIPFLGATSAHTYYVADAVGVDGLVAGRMNMRLAGDDFLLTFPMGTGRDRLLGVVRTGDNPVATEDLEAAVRERLSGRFAVRYASLNWFSTYRVHHRIAARFRQGQVFLAGDAAHIHSPVGAQGMNTGIQDAHNLACKLGDVLTGGAPDRYLDRYESERRPVAKRLVASTDRVFSVITSPRPVARLIREHVVPVVAPVAPRIIQHLPGAARLFGALSQIRIRYPMGPPEGSGPSIRRLVREPAIGRRLLWNGENHECLRSLTWQLHAYDERLAERTHRIGDALGVEVHVFRTPGMNGLRPHRLYLVRPDGFVADSARPDRALERFRSALAAGPVPPSSDVSSPARTGTKQAHF